ncbi:dTDP-4-dehydrorhamnose 3,5-epimerase [Kamptonema formosum]|uniref:dTDP-4-dehydrorhamnose 3,5-epimerase n=1 Tax=Kamptonema formosum TaxID=331992 RepID=UPI000349AD53|nr:dTDP-4-dehydrorhamnose 3,5-epimerase [Oscillatoria sp. PCC 10802]
MQIRETKIPGCYEITPDVFKDERGSFVKTFHQDIFKTHQLETKFAEEYYSVSHRNVLRGLHFQLPPEAHTKMVYCVQGQVIDAVVDLRVGSPTFGQFALFDLSAEKANTLYIPPGVAHGFYVTGETAIMMYKVSTVYSPEHDTGIHWDSVGIPWPCTEPIVSKRDSSFAALSEFKSPFIY